jgi:putative cell wall-binding protein
MGGILMQVFNNAKKSKIGNRIISLTLVALMSFTSVAGVVAYADVTKVEAPTINLASVTVNVELNGQLNGGTVNFVGGTITSSNAPGVTNAKYSGASVWIGGDKNKAIPIKFLTSSNGKILYKVNDNGTNSVKGDVAVDFVNVLGSSDKVVFSYVGANYNSTKFAVDYVINQTGPTDLSAIGGHVKIVSDLSTIGMGEAGYFQLIRTGGTVLKVKASNGTLTKVNTSKNGLVETWKITGVTGNTTITIDEDWEKVCYNLQLTVKSAALPSNITKSQGRIVSIAYENAEYVIGPVSNDETKALMRTTLSGTDSMTMTYKDPTVYMYGNGLSYNWGRWNYIGNNISFTGNGNDGHQVATSILIDSGKGDAEAVPIPKKEGESVAYILTKGEKAGTRVIVYWFGHETTLSGQAATYDIIFDNVHTDLNTTVNYANTNTNNLALQGAYGVEVANISSNTPQVMSDGTNLQVAKSGSYATVIGFKALPGYYNPTMKAWSVTNGQKTYDSATINSKSGAYERFSFSEKNFTLESDPATSMTISATPITYYLGYATNGGSYTDGKNPTDLTKTYKVDRGQGANANSVMLINGKTPVRDGYVFAGYRLNYGDKGKVFWPNDIIDLNDSSSIDLSTVPLDTSTGQKGLALVTLIAQWTPVTAATAANGQTAAVSVNIYQPSATQAVQYNSTTSTFIGAVGAEYIVYGYPKTTGNLSLYSTDKATGTVAASNNSVMLVYKKPVTVTYNNNNTAAWGTMPTNASNVYAYDNITLSSNKLNTQDLYMGTAQSGQAVYTDSNTVKATYKSTYKHTEHTGWVDGNGVEYALGQTVALPYNGLSLTANFKESTTEVESYAEVKATNFTIPMATAQKLVGKTVTPEDELGQTLMGLAGATASKTTMEGGKANKVTQEIAAINHEIKAKDGEYTVEFISQQGISIKVKATVQPSLETMTASTNRLELTVSEAASISNTELISRSGVKAYDVNGSAVSVSVKSRTIQAAAGEYKVIFEANNTSRTTYEITVKVYEPKVVDKDIDTGSGTTTGGSSSSSSTGTGITDTANKVLTRYSGTDRVATSLSVADAMKSSPTSKFGTIIVVSANSFADALAGSYLAYVTDAPIITVNPKNHYTVEQYIKNNLSSTGTVYILGGSGAVENEFELLLRQTTANGMAVSKVTRLAGANRYATNVEIIKEAYAKAYGTSKLDTTILVCAGNEYADSLSAAATKKPILLVDKNMLNGTYLKSEQISYLRTAGIKGAIMIGGTGAVVPEVENEIKAVLGLASTERISGYNRYETSVKIAERFFSSSSVTGVTFAYGLDFPDGLAAGPLAIKNNSPLILIAGTEADVITNPYFFVTDSRARYAKAYVGTLTAKNLNFSVVGGTSVLPRLLVESITGATEH